MKIHKEFVRCDLLVFDYYNGTETKENNNYILKKKKKRKMYNVTGNKINTHKHSFNILNI